MKTLATRRDRRGVEQRQELRAAVAAADADDAGDGRIGERLLQVRGPQRRLPGQVAAGLGEHALVDRQLEAERLELDGAAADRLFGARAGRRHDRQAIAGPQCARTPRPDGATALPRPVPARFTATAASPRPPSGARAVPARPAGPGSASAGARPRKRAFGRRIRAIASSTRLANPMSLSASRITRLERPHLLVVVAVADQQAVAAGAQARTTVSSIV